MKKTISLFAFLLLAFSIKAQIIITGIMYDPAGYDAHTDGYKEGTHTHKGGYEYVQLKATKNIDFATENYSIVFCRNNSGTTAANLENGWAAGGNRTIKVNLTIGSVVKGEFFYVGGAERVIGGYRASGASLMLSINMSSSKWYPLAYAVITGQDGTKGANTIDATINVGDSFDEAATAPSTPYYGKSTAGLLHNGAAEPSGVGVFAGTNVTKDNFPIDAVFYCGSGTSGTTTIDGTTGISYVYNSTNGWGYKMPNNDRYSSSFLFGQGTNTIAMVRNSTTDESYFLKLGGDYNTQTGTWDIKRSANYVQVADKSKTTLAAFQIGNAATIESATGVTTLPVELAGFDAKSSNDGVKLIWATASETNNAYFSILRSTDGVKSSQIGTVLGNGTNQVVHHYNYTDNTALSGTNYYQLKQVDNNGQFSLSKVIAVNVGLSVAENISAHYNGNELNVIVNVRQPTKGALSVVDISGRTLASSTNAVTVGQNRIALNKTLNKGVYLVVFKTAQKRLVTKLVTN